MTRLKGILVGGLAGLLFVVSMISFWRFWYYPLFRLSQETRSEQPLGSGGPSEYAYYDAIGTSSSRKTFTFSFNDASSTVIMTRGMSNVVIAGQYKPKSEDSRLYIALERSLDGGVNFQPYSVLSPLTSQTLVYSDSLATTGTTAVPFVVPGDLTSTSGTAISFSFDLTLAADYLRISAKEYATGTRGTGYIQILMNSN